MIKTSVSFTHGTGNIDHNLRWLNVYQNHIDSSRTKYNSILFGPTNHEELKELYNSYFNDAVKKFNDATKRKDRKIDNFYDYARTLKSIHGQRPLYSEFVMQLGNSKIINIPNEILIKIYQEYIEDFKKRNPTLKPICAVIHNDETSPHLHLDVVPVATTKKKLGLTNSFVAALEQLGYPKNKRFQYKCWRDDEVKALCKVMEKYGYERQVMDNNSSHAKTIHPYTQKIIQQQYAKELSERDIGNFHTAKDKSGNEYIAKNSAAEIINAQKDEIVNLKNKISDQNRQLDNFKQRDYDKINHELEDENKQLKEQNDALWWWYEQFQNIGKKFINYIDKICHRLKNIFTKQEIEVLGEITNLNVEEDLKNYDEETIEQDRD
jgi:hypothetical protein